MNNRYLIYCIFLCCSLLFVSCGKELSITDEIVTNEITAVPIVTPTPTLSPIKSTKIIINLELKEFTNIDNTYPENLYETSQKKINKIYKTYDYDKYQFIVYDGTDKGLHIGYQSDGKYYSLCQVDNWDSGLDRETFEQGEQSIQFSTFKMF